MSIDRRFVCFGLASLFLMSAPSVAETSTETPSIEVVGTQFRLTTPDGKVRHSMELAGAILTVKMSGTAARIRIESVEPDPEDPTGEIYLHRFTVEDSEGQWRPVCDPDASGRQVGFPLSGIWTADGRHVASSRFEIACTSGATGKCVRLGYKPWKAGPDGASLWDHHQACTRMIRADYCGDGHGFTRDGELIDVSDASGIQQETVDQKLQFEAGWAPDGAVCVARTRVPANASLETLAQRCPARLKDRLGASCTRASAQTMPGALIFNHSGPKP